LFIASALAQSIPRLVTIKDQNFVITATGQTVLLKGPNVVVKGPPWIPTVAGDSMC